MLVTDRDDEIQAELETPAPSGLKIKYEGSNKYEIPSEFEGLFETMVNAINQEYEFTDSWLDACAVFDKQFSKYGVLD